MFVVQPLPKNLLQNILFLLYERIPQIKVKITQGYYTNTNPIGYKGDFITSPNISIMFSEMLTIWLISFWEKLGCPKKINIIELGAGNGEMINQILKTIENFRNFKLSAKFYIHEKSLFLKKYKKIKIKNMK